MSTRTIKKSVLFRTNAYGTDVQSSGGQFTIAGLDSVRYTDVVSFSQIKYRAEVAQVVTVTTSAQTPVGGVKYTVAIGDPRRTVSSVNQAPVRTYSYVTPADITTLGATAALQREAINVAIIAKINADTSNYVVAATSTGGAGFTITDDGSYYPVWSQTMTPVLGASQVYTVPNSDSSGFPESITAITTAAAYSVGVGAKLAQMSPVMDAVFNNLISGQLGDAPLTTAGLPAVSGQNYDAFAIEDFKLCDAITLGGQFAYQKRFQTVYADNGTGTATTNATAYAVFEKSMFELLFRVFKDDTATIYYLGDTGVTCGGLGTGLPSGTAQAENFINLGNGFTAHYSPIATATVVALTADNLGIGLILDETNAEGVEFSAPTWAASQKSFVVGKSAFSVLGKINIDDVTGVSLMWLGFRIKAAYGATFTSYTDYAAIGLGNALGDIYTNTEKNGGGNTATDTTDNWADLATKTLEVRVDINGAVTFYINGYKPTVTQTFSFDAGDELIPMIYTQTSTDIGTPKLGIFAALNSDQWRS